MTGISAFCRTVAGRVARHRKLAWFCLLASMLGACFALWGREGSGARPSKSAKPIACAISFQRYSNSPSGQKWAILLVTNRDFGTLYFEGPFLVEPPLPPADDSDETHWQKPQSLPPESSAEIAVEIPPSFRTWHARCTVVRVTWRDRARSAFPLWYPSSLIPIRRTYAFQPLVTDWVPQNLLTAPRPQPLP